MGESIFSKLISLTEKYNKLMVKYQELSKNTESKRTTPYSKVKHQLKLENLDLVFDGNTGIWKTYAIYKDDEE